MSYRSGRARLLHNRLAIRLYARFLTRFSLALILPNEILKLGKPLTRPFKEATELGWTERCDALFVSDVLAIDEPRLQALLSRYDLDDFVDDSKRGARNWIDYGHRMHFIGNLFRSRHEDPGLLSVRVFDQAEEERIRNGDGGSPWMAPASDRRRQGI
ncbi:MAG: hypothetical protein R2715_23620 [Ilumatobacteraceae bacterium]